MIWIYEGGLRGPHLIKWPGTTLPGNTTEAKTISTDFYPTLLEVAGLPNREGQYTDGISIVPILKGEEDSLERDALYWHYPNYSNQGGFPGGALRIGDWKLIERYEDGRVHLYNVVEDMNEQNDLTGVYPDRRPDGAVPAGQNGGIPFILDPALEGTITPDVIREGKGALMGLDSIPTGSLCSSRFVIIRFPRLPAAPQSG